MGKFKFEACKNKDDIVIPDLLLITPTIFGDERGYFMETYNAEFEPYIKHIDGTPATFVQDNESRSCRGVLRGLHFQKTKPQGKLVRVIEGEVYDVALDLRKLSPTYGSYYGLRLSAENNKQFYVPEGFAHGFLVMSEAATVLYKCTRIYNQSDESGIIWNDPIVGIEWPVYGVEVALSVKDKGLPHLSE